MSNETVTYSLEAVLTRIESKIDKIDERLTKLEIGQAELKAELKGDIKVLDEKIGLLIRNLPTGGFSSLWWLLSWEVLLNFLVFSPIPRSYPEKQ